jgi:hypothetical protein
VEKINRAEQRISLLICSRKSQSVRHQFRVS